MSELHIAISGGIDLAAARGLADRLHRRMGQSTGNVIVDCSAVTSIDSVGLRTLVEAAKGLAAQNRSLTLARLRPACRQAVETSGLAGQFGLTQDA